MRTDVHAVTLALVLSGCGGPEDGGHAMHAPASAPAPAGEEVERGQPAVSEAEASDDAGSSAEGAESCEGLVATCGGWVGCVHVRADPTLPGHLVGIGSNAGASYFRDASSDGAAVRNETCTPDGSCRLGVRAADGPDCTVAQGPSRAPFTCALTESGCVETTVAAPSSAPRCMGLIAPCGGWDDCVQVTPDPAHPDQFVGSGANVGHTYLADRTCLAGRCNEVCTSGPDRTCGPGVHQTDVRPPVCAASQAPAPAPFTCSMIRGRCLRGP